GNLRSLETLRDRFTALSVESRYFQEISAVVRPYRKRSDAHVVDELGILRIGDNGTQAALSARRYAKVDPFTLDNPTDNLAGNFWGAAQTFSKTPAQRTATFILFAPVSATRLLARRNESKVPASVHQPSRKS